jgi:hypothetical protein
MAANSKTVLTLVIGAVVGVGPAYFGYLQSRDELKAKYQQTQDEASSGYAALSTSVKELQAEVTTQHDYIIKLQTHLDDMDKYMTETRSRVVAGTPGPHHVADTAAPAHPPTAPDRPKFHPLPGDFDAAIKEYGPR